MHELTTTASFTERRGDDESLTTIVARSVLEAALQEGDPAQLWFEVGSGDDETWQISVDVTTSDLEHVLRLSGSDDVALTLDADAVAGLFDAPEVEAHGMKGTLAIAVTSAALLAPAGQAAVPQSVGAAATVQRAHVAATVQRASSARATTQVSSVAAQAQAAGVASRPEISTSLVVRASGLRVRQGGLDRELWVARSART